MLILFRPRFSSIISPIKYLKILKSSLNTKVRLLINDYKVLDVLKGNPNQIRENIAAKIGIDKRTVQRSLDRLVEAKYIMRIESKKTGYWNLLTIILDIHLLYFK